MLRTLRHLHSEGGQVLPLFVMLLVAFLALIGLAVDAGRIYVARAEMSRALDAAALAGVLELPDRAAAQARASAYMQENQSDVSVTFPTAGDNQFRVQGRRGVSMLVMRIVGFGDVNITGNAAAGFGIVPADTTLLVDATGSMGASPCNSSDSNSGCPIKEAKDAADGFAEFFLSGSNPMTQVGYTPFRGCHNPPRTHSGCVTDAMLEDLTTDLDDVEDAITSTTAIGGTGTNVCLALYKAREMFEGPNAQTASNTVKSIVILTDGDNTYNSASYSSSQGAPPTDCRPASNYTSSDNFVGTGCSQSGGGSASSSNPGSSSEFRERSLDRKTRDMAKALKDAGIEIYVVAFGACGSASSTVYTSNQCRTDSNGGLIGNSDPDTTADQRLLKCIASSTTGTNDHFYSVPTAEDLPDVFQDIAHAIAFRLIE
jgi:Flp pilus assembly protein TadG